MFFYQSKLCEIYLRVQASLPPSSPHPYRPICLVSWLLDTVECHLKLTDGTAMRQNAAACFKQFVLLEAPAPEISCPSAVTHTTRSSETSQSIRLEAWWKMWVTISASVPSPPLAMSWWAILFLTVYNNSMWNTVRMSKFLLTANFGQQYVHNGRSVFRAVNAAISDTYFSERFNFKDRVTGA